MFMIINRDGQKKYLSGQEREAFIAAARSLTQTEFLFCATLTLTGCRISEALALLRHQISPTESVITIRSLKKRGQVHHRQIPVPSWLTEMLADEIDVRSLATDSRLWPWSRTKGWGLIKLVMQAAKIDGVHASPKGLRHGFGVAAIEAGIPLNLIQKWLGHTRIETTAIYTNAVGPEERRIAARMWC